MDTDVKEASITAALEAAGESVYDDAPVDYFGVLDTKRVPLPDGKQWFDIKALNEGERKRYLNQTNNEVRVHRGTQDAAIKTKPGDDKHLLLAMAIVDFNVVRGSEPLRFTPANLNLVLDQFPPHIIDIVEKEVRKKNPWLLADMTLEDMVKERDNLDEMIDVKRREETGKDV